MPLNLVPSIKLNNSVMIPQIGLGLWKVDNEKHCRDSVNTALDAGYTHFDSAQIYGNEKFLGYTITNAINSSDQLTRQDLFITTKLWNDNHWPDDATESIEQSLKNLQTNYIDLLLIHFPVTATRHMAWQILEKFYANGQAKAIGVSNYTIDHLEKMIATCDIVPAVNQVELHVFLQQPELRKYCDEKGIIIEAYSPLAHGHGLDNKDLNSIGQKYGKSSAQIMLRWCLQNGMVIFPKSITPSRIKENIDLFDFELASEDLDLIADLNKNYRTCWDPTEIK